MPKHKGLEERLGPKNTKGGRNKRTARSQKFSQRKRTRKVGCPPEYKRAAQALRAVVEKHLDLAYALDTSIDGNRLVLPLVKLAIKYHKEVEYLLTHFNILEENEHLNTWKLKVIMTEMIWGKQSIRSSESVVEAMRYYEESVREKCMEINDIFPGCLDSAIPVLPTYVRVNKLQIKVEDAIRGFTQDGWKLLPSCNTYSEHLHLVGSLGKMKMNFMRDFHIPELLVFPPRLPLYNHQGYLTGKFLLQDKGSCLSSFLLNPKPGSIVLDLCAAPGLKTNHLANLMNNNGLLYANDIHPARFAALYKLLEDTDVKCAQLSNDDLFDMQVPQNPKIDYILVDPSCTYSGIFSKLGTKNQVERLERSNHTLSAILRYALQSFPDVRRVVYTTCSVFPAEGEKVVDDALEAVGNSFTLVDLKEHLEEWMNQGITEIEESGKQKTVFACGSKCFRSVPEYDLCQGYFIAMFDRNFNVPVPSYEKRIFKENHEKSEEFTEESNIGDEFNT